MRKSHDWTLIDHCRNCGLRRRLVHGPRGGRLHLYTWPDGKEYQTSPPCGDEKRERQIRAAERAQRLQVEAARDAVVACAVEWQREYGGDDTYFHKEREMAIAELVAAVRAYRKVVHE